MSIDFAAGLPKDPEILNFPGRDQRTLLICELYTTGKSQHSTAEKIYILGLSVLARHFLPGFRRLAEDEVHVNSLPESSEENCLET